MLWLTGYLLTDRVREHAEASLSIGTEQEGDRQGALYVAWWLGGEPWMPCANH